MDDLTFEEISSKYPAECRKWFEDWINFRMKNGRVPKIHMTESLHLLRKLLTRRRRDAV